MTLERTLPALVVRVEGAVLETNIDAYRDAALEHVASINTTLQNDDDFAAAEGVVKWCSDAEKKIKSVKAQAMEQAADINAVFAALDEISAAVRDKRLALNKQVKAQKEERRDEAITAAMASLIAHVSELEQDLDGFRLPPPQAHEAALLQAAKGKKTLKGLGKALDKSLEAAKSEYAKVRELVATNAATLRAHKDHAFLFADAQEHVTKPDDEFKALVSARIQEHEATQTAQRERERESIRAQAREEERAKIEQEAAAAASAAPAETPAVLSGQASAANAHTHHTIDYIEIRVLDLAASKAFYGAAFGWSFTDYSDEYAGIQGDGREPGGLSRVDSVVTGGALIVLYSSDLDDTIAGVRRAGGRIVKEAFDFPGGRQFHFHDPSGNELAVWSEE